MSKRKPMDKAQARERRNQMLESAASARLSLTKGVREMRAIAGMTQEEFAQHRGVSTRVIKAIELEQGYPTVATLNRIGQFFGLEVGFVPVRREALTASEAQADMMHSPLDAKRKEALQDDIYEILGRELGRILNEPDFRHRLAGRLNKALFSGTGLPAAGDIPVEKTKKSRTR